MQHWSHSFPTKISSMLQGIFLGWTWSSSGPPAELGGGALRRKSELMGVLGSTQGCNGEGMRYQDEVSGGSSKWIWGSPTWRAVREPCKGCIVFLINHNMKAEPWLPGAKPSRSCLSQEPYAEAKCSFSRLSEHFYGQSPISTSNYYIIQPFRKNIFISQPWCCSKFILLTTLFVYIENQIISI